MEQQLSQANVEKSELEEIAANYQVGQAVQLPSTCMHERHITYCMCNGTCIAPLYVLLNPVQH